jgi:NAD(P)H dehydrogenase (quinone)
MESNNNKILVLYDSATGNTKKMAELVRDGAFSVSETDVRMLSVDEATSSDLFWCDGVACGSPTYVGLISGKMKLWWDSVVRNAWNKIDGKIGCAFASSGGRGGGAELVCQSITTIMLNFGMLVFGVPDYTGHGQTLHYGAIASGAPADGAESEACIRLGKRLSEWVGFYCHRKNELHPLNKDK